MNHNLYSDFHHRSSCCLGKVVFFYSDFLFITVQKLLVMIFLTLLNHLSMSSSVCWRNYHNHYHTHLGPFQDFKYDLTFNLCCHPSVSILTTIFFWLSSLHGSQETSSVMGKPFSLPPLRHYMNHNCLNQPASSECFRCMLTNFFCTII